MWTRVTSVDWKDWCGLDGLCGMEGLVWTRMTCVALKDDCGLE